ncbi:hypothetical protein LINGRAPRIM_LOCUS3148 [Linum grandiflorum]
MMRNKGVIISILLMFHASDLSFLILAYTIQVMMDHLSLGQTELVTLHVSFNVALIGSYSQIL